MIYYAFGLLALGLVLITLEVFFPSFGLLGTLAAIAIIGGGVVAYMGETGGIFIGYLHICKIVVHDGSTDNNLSVLIKSHGLNYSRVNTISGKKILPRYPFFSIAMPQQDSFSASATSMPLCSYTATRSTSISGLLRLP